MNGKKSQSNRATKPPLQRMIDTIQAVRRERGKKARGDFLLRQAQRFLRSNDVSTARAYLEMFQIAAPKITAEHRAVLSILLTKSLVRQKLKIPDSVLNLLNFISGLLKLVSVGRNLLSCRFIGNPIPIKI